MLRYFLSAATISLGLAVVASAQYNGSYSHGYHYGHAQKIVIAETLVVPVVVPGTAFINVAAPAYPPAVTVSASALERAQREQVDASSELQKRLDALDAKLSRLLAPATAAISDGPPKLRLKVSQERITLEQVAGIFSQHCSTCHSGSKSKGGVQIFNAQGEYEPNVGINALIDAALSDEMPKGPNKVPENQKRVLRAWKS